MVDYRGVNKLRYTTRSMGIPALLVRVRAISSMVYCVGSAMQAMLSRIFTSTVLLAVGARGSGVPSTAPHPLCVALEGRSERQQSTFPAQYICRGNDGDDGDMACSRAEFRPNKFSSPSGDEPKVSACHYCCHYTSSAHGTFRRRNKTESIVWAYFHP